MGWRPSYRTRIHLAGFAFVLPALVVLMVFKYVPMAWALGLSLTSYDMLTPPRYIGLENYIYLFRDSLFLQALGNTVVYVVGSTIPIWILALALALVFAARFPGKSFFMSALFLTNVMPVLVAAVVWKFLFHPHGLVNVLQSYIGIGRIDWLTDSNMAMVGIIGVTIWRFTPYFMVVYLAGLLAIPKEYYEAAALDGASAWAQFRHITVPLLTPVMVFVVVVSVLLAARIFLLPFVMTQGGPGGATRVLAMFIYETGFVYFKMGLAAAASTILFSIVLVFTIIQLRISRKAEEWS